MLPVARYVKPAHKSPDHRNCVVMMTRVKLETTRLSSNNPADLMDPSPAVAALRSTSLIFSEIRIQNEENYSDYHGVSMGIRIESR